jgi:predicted Zn-dependent peptidase
VEPEFVAAVSSALLPTEQPYLYGISATVRDGVPESTVEEALFTVIDSLASARSTDHTLQKAKNQLLTQLVFDDEGVTRIGHQLGYFSTVADWKLIFEIEGQIKAVTAEHVRDVVARRLASDRRTVGWFRPQALQ